MEALESLILAPGPERGTVLLAFALQGPLAWPVGLRNQRYGLFIRGHAGSLKTSVAQACIALYGADYMRDNPPVRWGEGLTHDAAMALAAHARDLPLMIDDYQPNADGGVRALSALMHNMLEGGEKSRLDGAGRLMPTRPVRCWPLITGRDDPGRDPALLVLPFEWPPGERNEPLAKAQALGTHLNAVGGAWLEWLETDDGTARAAEAGRQFSKLHAAWAAHLCDQQPEVCNPLRIASNLAFNQATYWAARCHPALGPLLERYVDAHQAGLTLAARTAVAG
jgi:hypothetical protein